MIGGKPEKLRCCLPGRLDLGAAVRALHEDHPAARSQARGHALEGLGDGTHGAGDDAGNPSWIVRAHLVRVDLDVPEPELAQTVAQKLSTSTARFGQDHPGFGTGDRQRYAGQPRPRTHVDQRRGKLEELQDQQAVGIMLQNHVLEIVNPRQIEPVVRGPERLVIAPEQVDLIRGQEDSTALQDRFQRGSSGSHDKALGEPGR